MNVFLENGITCLDLHGERHPDVKDIVIDLPIGIKINFHYE